MCLGDIRNKIGALSPSLLQALPTLAQVPTECHRASPAYQFQVLLVSVHPLPALQNLVGWAMTPCNNGT